MWSITSRKRGLFTLLPVEMQKQTHWQIFRYILHEPSCTDRLTIKPKSLHMRLLLTLTFFLYVTTLTAQSNAPYLTDLASIRTILQNTPSYKAQIKGDKATSYNVLYNRLTTDTVINTDDYRYFYNLSQLFFPIRDNHLSFYQIPKYDFRNHEDVDKFIKTKEFTNYPRLNINTDSLKTVLALKPVDSIEGIYHYEDFYSIGLFKTADKEYIGVILDSTTPLWEKGHIAIHLYQYGPNFYKAIYGHPLTKGFILQSNEKYRYKSLVNSYFYGSYSKGIYSKEVQSNNYVNLPHDAAKFQFKSINALVQYLRIRSFQADNVTSGQSNTFYMTIKDSLTAPYLILDLRNNEGGAEKESEKYFNLLKKYTRTGHIYILVNNETLSGAEIVTLQLKKLQNTITAGQPTKGMLTYGSNYGRREILPSKRFAVYITDMKGKAEHLLYEDYGINPDISLDENADWIEQIVTHIKKVKQ
jgi:hypothetical protein